MQFPFYKTSLLAQGMHRSTLPFLPSAFLHSWSRKFAHIKQSERSVQLRTLFRHEKALQPDLSSTHPKPNQLCYFQAKNLGTFQRGKTWLHHSSSTALTGGTSTLRMALGFFQVLQHLKSINVTGDWISANFASGTLTRLVLFLLY